MQVDAISTVKIISNTFWGPAIYIEELGPNCMRNVLWPLVTFRPFSSQYRIFHWASKPDTDVLFSANLKNVEVPIGSSTSWTIGQPSGQSCSSFNLFQSCLDFSSF